MFCWVLFQRHPYHTRILWCEYKPGAVPYAPYKLEVILKDPFLSMFHDIISDSEATMLKERAKPQVIECITIIKIILYCICLYIFNFATNYTAVLHTY